MQIIPGAYKSDKTSNILGVDKLHLKADCKNGGIVNGVKRHVLYSFSLDKPPGHKIMQEHRVKLFKKINKSVLFYSKFHLEDDDNKPVEINLEAVSFSCQINKIYSSKRT